jgi:hypothetical protein
MKCTNCGSEVPETAKVCGNCGHRLKSASPPALHPSPEVHRASKRLIPGWLWGIGGLLAITVIGILIVGFSLLQRSREVTKLEPVVFEAGDSPSDKLNTLPQETQAPRVMPSPVSSPKVGLYPNANAVWDDWVYGRIQSLRGMVIEEYDKDRELLDGSEYFSYTVKLKQTEPVLWDTGWCAMDEQTLRVNVSSMEFEYSINGQTISRSLFGIMFTPNGDHYCYYEFAVIKDWPLGMHIVKVVEVFKTDIDDGITEGLFPAGRKVVEYTVHVNP